MYCASCGAKISENSRYCEYCGTEMYTTGSESDQSYSGQSSSSNDSTHYSSTIEVKIQRPEYGQQGYPISRKSRTVTLLLWVFLGALGAHYFYAERFGMGILWLLTGGFFGIGLVIDIILILTGTFKDTYGKPIVNWDI